MSLVLDASVIVAALTDQETEGAWAEEIMFGHPLVAPQHVMVETANILRRLQASKLLAAEEADAAFDDLLELPLDLQPFEPFARRIWQLRQNLTSYDAWYVSVAEAFGLPLVTLDRRLSRAPGIRCEVRTPPARGSRN